MRGCWVLIALLWAWGYADRVIEVPTGRLLYPQWLKAELGTLDTDRDRTRWLLNCRVGSYLELSASRSGVAGETELLGLQIGLYPEIPNYTPGISLGVTDLFDKSRQGRGYYLAISYSVPMLGETPLDYDLRFHLGFGFEGMPSLFVGFEVPLTNHLFALAEHNGDTINAALVWQPLPQLQLRASVIQNRTSWSLLLQLGEE
jgi:hypothetical protein